MKYGDIKPWKSLNWPNRISILRLMMVAPFIILILNEQTWGNLARYAALGIFVTMAFSDFIDGVLARRLNQRTRLGAVLDPLADKVLIISSVVLLAQPQIAPVGMAIDNWVVVAVVAKDLWVIFGFIVVYLVTDRFRVRPVYAGKLATVGQLAMVISVLIGPDLNKVNPSMGTILAKVMEYIVAAMSVAAAISYTRLGLSFVHEGQKPIDENHAKEL